jgi:hypothetical protein
MSWLIDRGLPASGASAPRSGLLADGSAGLLQRIDPFLDDPPGRVLVRQHEDGGTGDVEGGVGGAAWARRADRQSGQHRPRSRITQCAQNWPIGRRTAQSPTRTHADVSEFRHRILMQRPASPLVISNAVRGTWLGAGTHLRVGQIAEYLLPQPQRPCLRDQYRSSDSARQLSTGWDCS